MKLVAATQNPGKLREFKALLERAGHTLVSIEELAPGFSVEETGDTLEQNALLKARASAAATGLPALADDTGLLVDALDGAPGVYSARYSGGGEAENRKKLLREMQNVPPERRSARFITALALVYPNGEQHLFSGVCEGAIGTAETGENGFGYDSVFMVEGRSFAQFSPEEKNRLSHRGKALAALEQYLQSNSQTDGFGVKKS